MKYVNYQQNQFENILNTHMNVLGDHLLYILRTLFTLNYITFKPFFNYFHGILFYHLDILCQGNIHVSYMFQLREDTCMLSFSLH